MSQQTTNIQINHAFFGTDVDNLVYSQRTRQVTVDGGFHAVTKLRFLEMCGKISGNIRFIENLQVVTDLHNIQCIPINMAL